MSVRTMAARARVCASAKPPTPAEAVRKKPRRDRLGKLWALFSMSCACGVMFKAPFGPVIHDADGCPSTILRRLIPSCNCCNLPQSHGRAIHSVPAIHAFDLAPPLKAWMPADRRGHDESNVARVDITGLP